MGRRTYEGFFPVWSGKSGDPYSDKINSMEKLVASTTLSDPEWTNTTVVADGLVEEVARRKQTEGDIVQYGFGPVSRARLDAGLLDELRLWVPGAKEATRAGLARASSVLGTWPGLIAVASSC